MSDDRFEELDDSQRALARKLRTTLRESEQVDAVTSTRLARARAYALAEGTSPRPTWIWATGGLTAAAIVAALLLIQFSGLQRWRADPAEASAADAIEVLTDEMDADFYEDLELYRWLAEDARA